MAFKSFLGRTTSKNLKVNLLMLVSSVKPLADTDFPTTYFYIDLFQTYGLNLIGDVVRSSV